jgi:hypothetical protein
MYPYPAQKQTNKKRYYLKSKIKAKGMENG